MEKAFLYGLLYLVYYLGLAGLTYYTIRKNSPDPLHMMQLEGYQPRDYKLWLKENKSFKFALKTTSSQNKTPLVWTDRAKRLHKKHLTTVLLVLLVFLVLSIFLYKYFFWLLFYPLCLGIFAYSQFQWIILAAKLNLPLENKINQGFYDAAKEKIRARKDLSVVGITGSFGKTSTKFMTATILEEAFKVQTTPSSFNTPLVLSQVINNDVTDKKEVFVSELGAKV